MSSAKKRRHEKANTSDTDVQQDLHPVTDIMARAKHFLDNMRDYPLWTEPGGDIVEVSEATCRALGYTRDELLNMTVFDVSPTLTREFWRQRWELLRKVGFSEIETKHLTKDGRLVPVELTTSLVKFEDNEYHCAFCRDITERKKVQDDIKRLRYSLDNMEDYPTWNDSEGRLIEVSESTCRHLEYTRDELLDMTVFDICPDIDRQRWADTWRESEDTQGGFRVEVHHRTKSGRVFPVEITVNSMIFDGKPYHCTFCRDMTERRQAESALERLRYSLDQMNDYFIWVDSEARVIEVSDSTCRHLEYTREELLNMTAMDISPGLTAEHFATGWERAKKVGSFDAETTHLTKSGRVFPAEMIVNHMVFDNQEYDCVFFRDISERKALEDSLRLTQTSVDILPDMIHWLDREGNILYANQSMCEFLGYSLDELKTMPIWDVDPDLDAELLGQRWGEAARGGVFFEGTWKAKDGSRAAVDIAAVNIDQGGTEMAVSFARDITERKAAEHSLKESEERYRQLWEQQTETLKALGERDEQLLQAQKMEAIGRLAGGIAHDFNNVLTTIIGYSDLLLSSPDCPEGSIAEDINEIREAAQRAASLTQRILAFSRRQAMQPTLLSLNDVVADTERLLARTIGADIQLKTSLSRTLGQVEIDEQQFVQVLLNLAVNARDAMPEGGTLTIATTDVDLDEQFCATHTDAHPGHYVKLTVADTGAGMDKEVLAHVFEPFYTTKPPGLGTGLGLATAYGIVTQSGGCIYIDSELGLGTTVSVCFPRLAAPPTRKQDTEAPGEDDKPTHTVVVVDSDQPFLTLTSRMLEKRGLRVLPFHSGDRAIKALADPTAKIDALVTDLALSGDTQGPQLAKLAARYHPSLRILFVSEQPDNPPLAVEGDSDSVTYLEKPFTAVELTRWVQTWLTETDQVDGETGR